MVKLSNTTTALAPQRKKAKSPIKQKKKQRDTSNVGGGDGSELKAKSELFLTAISTFAGEDSFYESGQARIDRVSDLTRKITESDPEWIERFVAWLRGPEVNIRTISLIIAAEYVAGGGENGRQVINSVCQRADEPAEILAYWMKEYYGWDTSTFPLPSPKLPQSLRKGLADACIKLYNEYSLLKYDGNSRGVSMPQVLNLVHPRTDDLHQKAIFQYIIDSAYGNEPSVEFLPMVAGNLALRSLTSDEFKETALKSEVLRSAGVTWEQMGGLLGGPWSKKAWESIIPTMGYMALLRNLRNFDAVKISDEMVELVCSRLTDPEQVAKSRQLPFRFLSAYKNTHSDNWAKALGKALDLSTLNVPEFDGSTLVLVDKSGSMDQMLGAHRFSYEETPSAPRLWEVGALFAIALAKKGENVDLAIFGDHSLHIDLPDGGSVLKNMRLLEGNNGVGHGTNIWGSVRDQYESHDRVVVFTDVQDNHRMNSGDLQKIPYIHTFDIGGYGSGVPLNIGSEGRYHYGGFSDATFKLMALLEHSDGAWPF